MDRINAFSEVDILVSYEKFLSPGITTYSVQDIMSTRQLFQSLFKPLALLRNIAYLSLEIRPFTININNLYHVFVNNDFLVKSDEFFFEYYFDCLWIEETKALRMCPWYIGFKEKLHTFNLDQYSSIIVVSYEERIP